jgi:hypothetical protein
VKCPKCEKLLQIPALQHTAASEARRDPHDDPFGTLPDPPAASVSSQFPSQVAKRRGTTSARKGVVGRSEGRFAKKIRGHRRDCGRNNDPNFLSQLYQDSLHQVVRRYAATAELEELQTSLPEIPSALMLALEQELEGFHQLHRVGLMFSTDS